MSTLETKPNQAVEPTFHHFTDQVRWWWVLRGPNAAVSLTAIVLDEHAAGLIANHVASRNGTLLMPEVTQEHRRPTDYLDADADFCAGMGGPCVGEVLSSSEANKLLRDWVAGGWDDEVIVRVLAVRYAELVGGAA